MHANEQAIAEFVKKHIVERRPFHDASFVTRANSVLPMDLPEKCLYCSTVMYDAICKLMERIWNKKVIPICISKTIPRNKCEWLRYKEQPSNTVLVDNDVKFITTGMCKRDGNDFLIPMTRTDHDIVLRFTYGVGIGVFQNLDNHVQRFLWKNQEQELSGWQWNHLIFPDKMLCTTLMMILKCDNPALNPKEQEALNPSNLQFQYVSGSMCKTYEPHRELDMVTFVYINKASFYFRVDVTKDKTYNAPSGFCIPLNHIFVRGDTTQEGKITKALQRNKFLRFDNRIKSIGIRDTSATAQDVLREVIDLLKNYGKVNWTVVYMMMFFEMPYVYGYKSSIWCETRKPANTLMFRVTEPNALKNTNFEDASAYEELYRLLCALLRVGDLNADGMFSQRGEQRQLEIYVFYLSKNVDLAFQAWGFMNACSSLEMYANKRGANAKKEEIVDFVYRVFANKMYPGIVSTGMYSNSIKFLSLWETEWGNFYGYKWMRFGTGMVHPMLGSFWTDKLELLSVLFESCHTMDDAFGDASFEAPLYNLAHLVPSFMQSVKLEGVQLSDYPWAIYFEKYLDSTHVNPLWLHSAGRFSQKVQSSNKLRLDADATSALFASATVSVAAGGSQHVLLVGVGVTTATSVFQVCKTRKGLLGGPAAQDVVLGAKLAQKMTLSADLAMCSASRTGPFPLAFVIGRKSAPEVCYENQAALLPDTSVLASKSQRAVTRTAVYESIYESMRSRKVAAPLSSSRPPPPLPSATPPLLSATPPLRSGGGRSSPPPASPLPSATTPLPSGRGRSTPPLASGGGSTPTMAGAEPELARLHGPSANRRANSRLAPPLTPTQSPPTPPLLSATPPLRSGGGRSPPPPASPPASPLPSGGVRSPPPSGKAASAAASGNPFASAQTDDVCLHDDYQWVKWPEVNELKLDAEIEKLKKKRPTRNNLSTDWCKGREHVDACRMVLSNIATLLVSTALFLVKPQSGPLRPELVLFENSGQVIPINVLNMASWYQEGDRVQTVLRYFPLWVQPKRELTVPTWALRKEEGSLKSTFKQKANEKLELRDYPVRLLRREGRLVFAIEICKTADDTTYSNAPFKCRTTRRAV